MSTGFIDVKIPVGRAFDFATDVTRWPLWFVSVVSAQHPDQRDVTLGEELHVCLRDGRDRRQENFEVTRFVRNAFFWLEGALSTSRRIELRFEQRADVTRIGLTIGYPVFGGWLGRAVDSMSRRPKLNREVTGSLSSLKSVLEDVAGRSDESDAAPSPQQMNGASQGAKEPLFV